MMRGTGALISFILCVWLLACVPGCSLMAVAGERTQKGAENHDSNPTMPVIEKKVLRSRPIDRPAGLGDPRQWTKGDHLTIPLFDGEICHSDVTNIARNIRGTATLTATVWEPSPGHLIAVTTGGRSLITITMPGKKLRYIITCDEGSLSCRLDEATTEELSAVPEADEQKRP